MHLNFRPTSTVLLLTLVSSILIPLESTCWSMQSDTIVRGEELRALAGDWLYVEDRTEGRPIEKQQPPMSVKFALRLEKGAVIQVRGEGQRKREERISLDGSTREVKGTGTVSRYRGEWKNGKLRYTTEIVREKDQSRVALIQKEFQATPDGLMVRVIVGSPAQIDGIALYKHPKDIELPKPANAAIADVAWLDGVWEGKPGKSSTEERWTPPKGGAMLGTSRTVANGKMVAFEYLRIIERDGGLVYVAQPGGRPATEFVLTQIKDNRAVFENPRHDFPQKISYERSKEGNLAATIGFINGGRPQKFEFSRGK